MRFVQVSEENPFIAFDTSERGITDYESGRAKGIYAPKRGGYLLLGRRDALLCVTGPTDVKRPEDGMPQPLQISLHRESSFSDIPYLAEQVYAFSCHSWRSFLSRIATGHNSLLQPNRGLARQTIPPRSVESGRDARPDRKDDVVFMSEAAHADPRQNIRARMRALSPRGLDLAFATWLLREPSLVAELQPVVDASAAREGADQDFENTALLGFAAGSGVLSEQQLIVLGKGLRRLAGPKRCGQRLTHGVLRRCGGLTGRRRRHKDNSG